MDIAKLEQLWIATMKMGMEAKENLDNRVFELLRNAKSMINECRLDEDADQRFLKQAEDMIIEAQHEIYQAGGEKFIGKWDALLGRVLKGEKLWEFPIQKPSFYPNMHKGKWIKITPPKGLRIEKLEEIAKKHGAEMKSAKEGYILIGSEEILKSILKDIRALLKVRS